MGVYINRDELCKRILKTMDKNITDGKLFDNYGLSLAQGFIIGSPTIDLVTCGECKHLEVINKAPIYAHCHKWSYDFKLWQEDTRTNFCSWGERRSDEKTL